MTAGKPTRSTSRRPAGTAITRHQGEHLGAAAAKRMPPPASAAWTRLEAALGEALAVLEPGQCLIVSAKRRGGFVQFLSLMPHGFHVEAASSEWLRPRHALDEGAVALLRELGWSDPTATREEVESSDGEVAGSSNFVRDWAGSPPFAAVAGLAVTTLRQVYGIRRPSQLAYTAFDPALAEILLPTLGLDRIPLVAEEEDDHEAESLHPETPAELRAAVLEALHEFSEGDGPEADEDGDVPLRYGSALIVVRVADDAPFVSLVSPLLDEIEPTPELFRALNDLTGGHRQIRFHASGRTVFAELDLPADPFVPDQLGGALAVMGHACDELGLDLQHRFGGQTAFEEEAPARARSRKTGYN